MAERTYQIPYSKSNMKFTLPAGMQGVEVVSAPVDPVADVRKAIKEALKNPDRDGSTA